VCAAPCDLTDIAGPSLAVSFFVVHQNEIAELPFLLDRPDFS
jgi:hypothetical protein